MVQINWTDEAIEDLKEIYEFISIDSRFYAKRQVQTLKRRTKILKNHPKAGKVLNLFMKNEIRVLSQGSYLILYSCINSTKVAILAIHHTSRNLDATLNRI